MFLKSNRTAFILWLSFVTIGLLTALLTKRGEPILWLNEHYSTWGMNFFTFMTRLGESWGFLVVWGYVFLFKSVRHQMAFLVVALLTLALVAILKHWVFEDAMRPAIYFEQLNIKIENLPEIPLNKKHSFPSGHTTSGFAYFFFAALCSSKQFFKAFFVVLAMLVGFSRVYLVQHFVMDVVAGSCLGVGIAVASYVVSFRWVKPHTFLDKKWLNG